MNTIEKQLKISQIKKGSTIRYYYLNPRNKLTKFVEGVVDLVSGKNIRLIGVKEHKEYLHLLNFEKALKVVDPGFNLMLPDEILNKSNLKEKQMIIDSKKPVSVRERKIISELFDKIKVKSLIRYWFPNPFDKPFQDVVVYNKSDIGFSCYYLNNVHAVLIIRKDLKANIEIIGEVKNLKNKHEEFNSSNVENRKKKTSIIKVSGKSFLRSTNVDSNVKKVQDKIISRTEELKEVEEAISKVKNIKNVKKPKLNKK